MGCLHGRRVARRDVQRRARTGHADPAGDAAEVALKLFPRELVEWKTHEHNPVFTNGGPDAWDARIREPRLDHERGRPVDHVVHRLRRHEDRPADARPRRERRRRDVEAASRAPRSIARTGSRT